MKKYAKLICAVLVLALALGLGACGKPAEPKNALEKIKAEGVLTVALSPDFSPMEFVDSSKTGQDQYVGFDVTLAKYLAEELGVRLELQADYYAGVWANNDNARYRSLEAGDIEKALNCAAKIGDDYLQKKAQGYVVSESFTHGTAQQRYNWLKKGMTYGDIEHGDSFSPDYSQL
jgi:ABC-type amino acid transport substrate-binding protein